MPNVMAAPRNAFYANDLDNSVVQLEKLANKRSDKRLHRA